MSVNRRAFIGGSFAGAVSLSLRAAVTGLPVSFLMNRATHAVTVAPKFTILAVSGRGEAMNVSAPGAFAVGNDDLANRIEHPRLAQVGEGVTRTVNGTALNAADLENGANFMLGDQQVRGARAYTALDQSFLDHLVGFWHRSGTNAHPEIRSVLKAHGAIKARFGNGTEELPAAIAQEMAPLLGTSTSIPFVLRGNMNAEGVPLNEYRPTTVKDLMGSNSRVPVDSDDMGALYDWAIDEVYKEVKANGTPNQMKFLDEHASSKTQARVLGDELSNLLTDVNSNTQGSELRTALALIKIKLAPVIVVNHHYSGDNHNDSNLSTEVNRTLEALGTLDTYWKLLQEHQLTDQVVYATINVFGRTIKRNSAGGRNHYGIFTNGFIHGGHLKGQMVGGLESARNNGVGASGINSVSGNSVNPDISANDTLAAFMKTIMAAAGVPEDRRNVRLPDGKVVESIFS